jgi:hypothetical protein
MIGAGWGDDRDRLPICHPHRTIATRKEVQHVIRFSAAFLIALTGALTLAQGPIADPATLAFEQGRWADAIDAYSRIVEADPDYGVSLLRIAQAQRELGRHAAALETLQRAHAVEAPEAMVDFERARNLAALGRLDDAIASLEIADHAGLRALTTLASARELAPLRGQDRFQRVERSVRARVYPCESMPAAREFDFWVGRWEVRLPDGTLVGHNTITKGDGGCSLIEAWEGAGGAAGSSISFFSPSMDQWRQIWVGSGGTLIDISGGWVDGAMRMQGTIEYVAQDQVLAFRGTWLTNDDGMVRQQMEEYDLATQSWRSWFDGFYRRVDTR